MTGLRQRGVSLIEAVVAMGVMAFGMLAVVGLQSTLRANGDLSKQRAEAVRIAQQSVEDWRSFTSIEAANGAIDYQQDIASDGPINVAGLNATYARTRTVVLTPGGSPPMKTLKVTVSWTDRGGEQQSVQLSSVIAGIGPDFAGALAVPSSGLPTRQTQGRNAGIPVMAKDLGDGRSGFVPPQPGGGTVTWVFNNTTGLIVGLCGASGVGSSALLTKAVVDACIVPTTAQLLSGYVRFAATAAQPDAAESEQPGGLPLALDRVTLVDPVTAVGPTSAGAALDSVCFDDSVAVTALAQAGAAVQYFCAITSSATGTWAGRSRLAPAAGGGWSISSVAAAGSYKVCRYTTLAGDVGAHNSDHPLDYTEAGSKPFAALTNQNFLVISAAHVCPTDVPAAGDFVNSNTRLHQDGTAVYNNP